MKNKLSIRDLIALPIILIGWVFIILGIIIGSIWTRYHLFKLISDLSTIKPKEK